jgi:2,4-didehydro-3-deoxy-L-rhamnonate hydrolase
MKLICFGDAGFEKPGVQLDDSTRLDVSEVGREFDESFFASDGLGQLQDWTRVHHQSVRLGSPIGRPSKIVCIGLNFRDHAAETGMAIPQEPAIFFKSTTSLVGPNDDLVIPRNATKVDWEELAVVIAKKALYLTKDKALPHIAGFELHNDYSERSFQLERGDQCFVDSPSP